jgi:hypothetical protein
MIISHVVLFFESCSHIIHLYFVPLPMINNSTSCDKIVYSTLVCFHSKHAFHEPLHKYRIYLWFRGDIACTMKLCIKNTLQV